MTDLIWLSDNKMERISSHFPYAHSIPRIDNRKTLSGIIFVIRNGARWRDVPNEYGHPNTTYNRFIRWSKLGVFNKILVENFAKTKEQEQIMIDTTHLKSHRTAQA